MLNNIKIFSVNFSTNCSRFIHNLLLSTASASADHNGCSNCVPLVFIVHAFVPFMSRGPIDSCACCCILKSECNRCVCVSVLKDPGLSSRPSRGRQACQHDKGDPGCHPGQKALEDLLYITWYAPKRREGLLIVGAKKELARY